MQTKPKIQNQAENAGINKVSMPDPSKQSPIINKKGKKTGGTVVALS